MIELHKNILLPNLITQLVTGNSVILSHLLEVTYTDARA